MVGPGSGTDVSQAMGNIWGQAKFRSKWRSKFLLRILNWTEILFLKMYLQSKLEDDANLYVRI